MNILVIGGDSDFEECRQKFGEGHAYSMAAEHREAEKFIASNDLVIDFLIDEEPEEFEIFADKVVTVLLNTAKITLAELAHSVGNSMVCTMIGFNGLPTFINRSVLEVCAWHEEDAQKIEEICSALQTDFQIVDDRVGLVTPRIVAMIINEAYYTVQEGTATKDDIDKAMKLGTNYPYGPFEWCERIGVKHIYELLEALYEDTKDERYKICPLLKKAYLALA